MKFTAILLLAAALQVCAKGHSQNINISVKNVSLDKVFKEIKAQTSYTFFYTDDQLQHAKKVTLQISNASIQQVLELCFKDQPYSYQIIDKMIVVKAKNPSTTPKELNILSGAEGLTTIDVSGKVTDSDGNPLAGASVKVKGTTNGTTTDASGVFVLKGVDENATLIFSYAEHETVELKVNGRTSITAALKRTEAELKEVIINKGYYTEKQRNTVGNVATVTAKDIEKQPVQNPLLALQGRVPGLEVVQNTGLPGGGVTVRIQGRNSINSGLDPLIVIDGVPFPTKFSGANPLDVIKGGSPLNFVNPGDIESIDILKDADATALYGSRAANGAILITTKKGKPGKSTISFNLEQGWGTVANRVDMLNTPQYLEMRKEALLNDNRIASSNPTAAAPFIYAPDLTIWDTTRYTDWQETLIGGTAKYTNINLGISGGSHDIQYLVGTTFNRTTIVFPGDFDDKRGTVHFHLGSSSKNDRLKVKLSGSYMYDQNRLPDFDLTSRAVLLAPNAPALYKNDGTLNWAPNAAGTSTWTNPLMYTLSRDYINTTKNLLSNLVVNYQIVKGLTIGGSIGYNSLMNNTYAPSLLESFAPERRSTAQRTAVFAYRNSGSWIAEPQVSFDSQLWKGIFSALIGTTIQKSSDGVLSIVGRGFPTDQLMATPLAATTTTINSAVNTISRYNAAFARVNYTLEDRYILNLTGRRDGSNKFGDNNKFNNFWSAGAAWILSDEAFIQKSLPFLSFGKLRASYGVTGNDQIEGFRYFSTYFIANPTILYQGGVNITANDLPNPNLQWEETKKWQGGVDLGFFANRLNLGFTYAHNRSSNQLIPYVLPLITGAEAITKNFPATIQNTSLEFTANTVNVTNKDFTWNTSLNLTIPRNKLVSFPGIENTPYANPGLGYIVGQPLGFTRVFLFMGLGPSDGNIAIADVNGSPSTFNTQYVIIDMNPKLYGGMVNSFQYKGLQVEFHIQMVKRVGGDDMYWNSGGALSQPGRWIDGNGSNQPVSVMNRWQKSGDMTYFPKFRATTFANFPMNSTDLFYNYNVSFVRLKNVALSWSLPAKVAQQINMQSLRVYAHAQNLATITRYRGMDPESGALGMPPLRMITVGVNVGF